MSVEQAQLDLRNILMEWRDEGLPVDDVVLAIEQLIREIIHENDDLLNELL